VVVHLAAKISDDYGWDDLHQTNVIGTRNVFEAARDAGVKRVIFTSSGATVAGYELISPYQQLVAGDYANVPSGFQLLDEDSLIRPRNLYAATKVWGEALARHYVDNHQLEIVCLRIGFASSADRPLNPREYSVWNSQRDVIQAIQKSIHADLMMPLATYFILSENRWGYRSIDLARRELGYEPQDKAEHFRGS